MLFVAPLEVAQHDQQRVNEMIIYSVDPAFKIPTQMVFGTKKMVPTFYKKSQWLRRIISLKITKCDLKHLNGELQQIVAYANEQWTLMKTETK